MTKTGLSAFTPATKTVEYPGGKMSVRGLALEDFTNLIEDHYPPMVALFERYVGESALVAVEGQLDVDLGMSDMKSVVLEAIKSAPGLIGDVIARAADETENPHIARLLPMGVQIDAVGKIVSLTLEAEGGMEKLMGTVNNLIASLSLATAKRSHSTDGSTG